MPPPVGADEIRFSARVDDALGKLRDLRAPEARAVLRRLDVLVARLVVDCQWGEVIPCPLRGRAKALEARHGRITNLYCCDLPGFWRMLYTVQPAAPERVVLVLELVPHTEYDAWF